MQKVDIDKDVIIDVLNDRIDELILELEAKDKIIDLLHKSNTRKSSLIHLRNEEIRKLKDGR